jgi:hypothetical protein
VLRIDREDREGVTVLRVEGRLSGEEVDELERETRRTPGRVELDLSALMIADERGLALLRSLRDSGASLAGASHFLQLLLGGSGHGVRRSDDAA